MAEEETSLLLKRLFGERWLTGDVSERRRQWRR